MRVIIFCAFAALVGCSDGTVPEATATGGAGGQAVAATGSVGGHVMMMTATGGAAGAATGTGGAAVADGGTDAQPDHPCPAGYVRCGYRGPTDWGTCVDLQTDIQNCGTCDHICPGVGVNCQAGMCQ